MPISAPPRHSAARKVGRKSLRMICRPSCIESRNRESAEIYVFFMLAPSEGRDYSAAELEQRRNALGGEVDERTHGGEQAAASREHDVEYALRESPRGQHA